MASLKGKRVLLFTSQLFNYHLLIKQQIEEESAIVHLYDERNNPSSLEKILIRKAHVLMNHKIKQYYANVIEKEKDFNPDFILFVSPEAATASILKMLRHAYPQSQLLLYMWDSVKNKGVEKILPLFDRRYSFDPVDCKKYKMLFRPLFYSSLFTKCDGNKRQFKYDVSFIGTIHSDRAKILFEIKEFCDQNNLSYYFYLFVPSKFLLILRWILTPGLRKWEKRYIHTTPLNKNDVAKISSETRCVIDINHPNQTGLTMRTIEMVGLNQKLMTTNKNIKLYDFYRPENQIIITREYVALDVERLKEQYKAIPNEIYYKYSLEKWIRDIFMLDND